MWQNFAHKMQSPQMILQYKGYKTIETTNEYAVEILKRLD